MRILRRSEAPTNPRQPKLGGAPPPEVPSCDHCGTAMDFMAQLRLGDAHAGRAVVDFALDSGEHLASWVSTGASPFVDVTGCPLPLAICADGRTADRE